MWRCRNKALFQYSNLARSQTVATQSAVFHLHISNRTMSTSRHAKKHNENTMRVAHITDLHWLAKSMPSPFQLLGKRIIGYLNLYVVGRRHYFQDDVRSAMLDHLREQRPDVVLITGDLTSTALEEEFKAAREELESLLDSVPVFLIPGNHDAYTQDTAAAQPIRKWFGQWMGGSTGDKAAAGKTDKQPQQPQLPLFRHRFLHIIGMDPCRPTVIGSNGLYPEQQLQALKEVLGVSKESARRVAAANARAHASKDTTATSAAAGTVSAANGSISAAGVVEERVGVHGAVYGAVSSLAQWMQLWPRAHADDHIHEGHSVDDAARAAASATDKDKVYPPFTLLATHYPVVDRSGAEYTSVHRRHGAENNTALLDVLADSAVLPAAICHGHDHLGMCGAVAVGRHGPVKQDVLDREAHAECERERRREKLPHWLINYWRQAKPLVWLSPTKKHEEEVSEDPADVPPPIIREDGTVDEAEWPYGGAVIPVFNPGSGSLAQSPPHGKGHNAWHRQAGYCMYTVSRRQPVNVCADAGGEAWVRENGAATGDGYEMRVQHFIHDGENVAENEVPFTYIRPEGQ